jgi:hypothetical protein
MMTASRAVFLFAVNHRVPSYRVVGVVRVATSIYRRRRPT